MGPIPINRRADTIIIPERCAKCKLLIEEGHEWYCKKGKMKYKETKNGAEHECY